MLVNRWLVLCIPGRAGKDAMFRVLAKARVHKNTHRSFKSLILAISKAGSVVVITEKISKLCCFNTLWCFNFNYMGRGRALYSFQCLGPLKALMRPDVSGPCGSIWVFLFFLHSCNWMLRWGHYFEGDFAKKKWLVEVCLSLVCSTAFPNNMVIGWYKQWLFLRDHRPGIKEYLQNPRRFLSSWCQWMLKIQPFLTYNHCQMLL